jgi:hypothetical protein
MPREPHGFVAKAVQSIPIARPPTTSARAESRTMVGTGSTRLVDPLSPERGGLGRIRVHGRCALAGRPLYDTMIACPPGFADGSAKYPPRCARWRAGELPGAASRQMGGACAKACRWSPKKRQNSLPGMPA